MKKKLLALCACVAFGMLASNSFAASGDMTRDDTGMITVDTTNMQNAGDIADNITFQPSTNVRMTGLSSSTSFAQAGFHEQVEDKEGGRQFGMGADSNVIYWLNISEDDNGEDPEVAIADTTAADAFDVANWNTL